MRGNLRWIILGIGVLLIASVVLVRDPIMQLLGVQQTTDCVIIPATEQDFAEAVAIGEGVFEPEIWTLQTTELTSIVSVSWFDYASEAIAHSQYLLYNCGYTQADLDSFYSNDGFDLILDGYDSWQQTAICERDGITLREFTLVYTGRDFVMRYWVQPVSTTRVRDIHLAFAVEDISLLEEYSARLFPNFTSCGTA